MRIVMTLLVRNEADVLEANLRLHRALGVAHFAVLDNGSTDGTAEVLARWRDAGLAHVTTNPDADTNEVFLEWQTRLARIAATELEADWVINNDADEFWLPLSGDLPSTFAAIPPDSHGMLAPRFEFVPRPDDSLPFWERMTLRERGTRVLPKIAHRACEDVRVGPGSHHVCSTALGIDEAAGKPSLRGLRRRPQQPPVIAPSAEFGCAILHLPLRSHAQFRTRLEIGLRIARTRSSSHLEEAVGRAIGADQAARRWSELVVDAATAQAGLADGSFAEDTRIRDAFDAIGPPGGELEPQRYDLKLDSVALEHARAELHTAALRGMSHNHAQALGERDAARRSADARKARLVAAQVSWRRRRKRLRDEIARARRRARRSQRRLSHIERSRWWRLRPRRPGRR